MYSRIQDCQLINENKKISTQGNQSNVPHNTCVSLVYPYLYLIKIGTRSVHVGSRKKISELG